MSEEELKNRINKIAVEIEKLEVSSKQKEVYITNKIDEEFNSKISEVELNLQKQQTIYDELNSDINELMSKKNDLTPIIKALEKQYNNLKKEREKALGNNLKAIAKEKKSKTKIIDKDIKLLERELKTPQNK